MELWSIRLRDKHYLNRAECLPKVEESIESPLRRKKTISRLQKNKENEGRKGKVASNGFEISLRTNSNAETAAEKRGGNE